MSFWFLTFLLAVGGYLLGAVPFAYFVGKVKGIDVRKVGSGNVGAMNIGRILGRPWFFVVFALDLLKGLMPSLVAGWWLTAEVIPVGPTTSIRNLCRLLVGLFAIVGHSYPVFLRFHGGKGVSTSLGVALGVFPEFTVPSVLSFLVWATGLGLTRMSSFGSVCGAVMFPLFFVGSTVLAGRSLADRWPFLAFAVVLACLVVARHRANIARILAGTETKVVRGGGGASA